MRNYRSHLGDGHASVYLPPPIRHRRMAKRATLIITAAFFAFFLWKGLPLLMVIMQAADGAR